MGMYDSFQIEYPLHIEEWVPDKYKSYIAQSMKTDGFQSKSMSCEMDNYFIDNNGHIFLEETTFFDQPEQEVLRSKIYFHGHINVYLPIYLDEENSSKYFWLEYDLKFTDSLLVRATMLTPTKEEINELH